jgi:hypothetical protein
MMNGDYRTPAWAELLDAVKMGERWLVTVAFTRAYGMKLFAFLQQHPRHARTFNEAMTAVTGHVALAAVAAYDFSQFGCVVDVGGGSGQLAAAILTANPLSEASCSISLSELKGRRNILSRPSSPTAARSWGDFFESVRRGRCVPPQKCHSRLGRRTQYQNHRELSAGHPRPQQAPLTGAYDAR